MINLDKFERMLQFDNIPLTICFKDYNRYNRNSQHFWDNIEFIQHKYTEVDDRETHHGERLIRFVYTRSNDELYDLWDDIQREAW